VGRPAHRRGGHLHRHAATLSGSTAYASLGKVLASIAQDGNLGYQSGWPDPSTGQVNMAARWYGPATGQFTTRDTQANSPTPNSASANPFAYTADNPLTHTDPISHGEVSGLYAGATHSDYVAVKAAGIKHTPTPVKKPLPRQAGQTPRAHRGRQQP
jgi:RHS repeat-associated protein